MRELLIKIRVTLEGFDEQYSEGMDHETGYEYARWMRDLLAEALEKLEVSE